MKKIMLLLVLLPLAVLLNACGGSRVVLLDSGKEQNAIVVTTDAGETVLDQTNTYMDLSASSTQVNAISQEELQQSYGDLIAVAPKKPTNFLLYFEPNGTLLTSDSEDLLEDVRKAIIERAPCEVNIIGHADSTGSKEYNVKLSLQRARQVRAWLDSQDLDIINVIVESYGEEDPLVPTADGIDEPRNRRVEVLVR